MGNLKDLFIQSLFITSSFPLEDITPLVHNTILVRNFIHHFMYVVRNYAAQSFELIENCLDRVEVKKAVFFNGIPR